MKSKKGFLIVDAACCLPVFLIAIGILLSLISQCGIEETVHHALVQSARCSSRTLSVSEDKEGASIAASAAFLVHWKSFFCNEWEDTQPTLTIQKLTFGEQVFLAGKNISIDHIARAYAKAENKILLPHKTVEDPTALKKVVYRPFVGESEQQVAYDMTRVYVFPKRGERYHALSCYILKSGGVELLLTANVRKQKKPCQICNSQELPDGAKVYTVQSNSGIYHRQSCPTITKDFISMSKSEAIAQGYTPCKICGGGEI